MTASTTRVLVAGRSQLVLDTTLALLTARGYAAHVTREFDDITDQVDAAELDVVVFGGQVTPGQKAQMHDALQAVNPRLAFLQGLAGIPGLIADQVDGWVAGEVPVPGQAPVYDAGRREIGLVLFAPLETRISVYWITEMIPPDPKSAAVVLVEGALSPGEHRFRIPDAVVLDVAFATVAAGGALWSFRLAAPAG